MVESSLDAAEATPNCAAIKPHVAGAAAAA
jgi:hypothetical protein